MAIPSSKNVGDAGHVSDHELIRGELTEAETHQNNSGIHVPAGGSTGQALVKTSNASGATGWGAVSGVPSGGTTGQTLAKASNADGDVGWADEGSAHTHATHSNPHSLTDLSDVEITSPATDSVVQFNGTSFVDTVLSLSDLSDVDLTGLDNAETLVWDSASSKFKPQPQSGGSGSAVVVQNSTPASPTTGLIWISPQANVAKKWDGSAWLAVERLASRGFYEHLSPGNTSALLDNGYGQLTIPVDKMYQAGATGLSYSAPDLTLTTANGLGRFFGTSLRFRFRVKTLPTGGNVLKIGAGVYLFTSIDSYLEIDSSGVPRLKSNSGTLMKTFDTIVANGTNSAFAFMAHGDGISVVSQMSNSADNAAATNSYAYTSEMHSFTDSYGLGIMLQGHGVVTSLAAALRV